MTDDKNNYISFIFFICIVSLFGFGLFSVILSPLSHMDTDTVIINGDDIDSYVVTDDGMINIVMKNEVIYVVALSDDDSIVDFTVNSEIYIELYRSDINYWWWDGVEYGGDYYLERIVKIPSGVLE